ncbi:hypothetical protein BDM02DRAFT_3090128 [Thelephora ganbajun]|uniref:Uncharacterized protein n=1 Tax=Thelephora ganbajun TaxID=370292 RepID=A0ACB6ZQF9_THEGA|nr:hypothetical protein BDM02DRAFT_3090128 [Thelephora ganbajun]
MPSSPSTIHPSPVFPRKTSDSDLSSSTGPGHLFLRPPPSPSIPPDSPQFADSYTYRAPHQRLVPPPLSSADSSSVSTRSSAYTNFGSGVTSVDYSHVVVANGEDDPSVGVGITSDEVVQLLGQHSSSSRTPVDAPTRWSQLQSGPRSRSSSVADSRANSLALSSSSKPGSDGDWRVLGEREEIGLTSESETDDEACLDSDDEDGNEEEQPTSAMVIAEEGRGVIVRGEGGSVHTIQAPPGTTHLLIASSSTPNAVPSFLANMLPQICETLLALDVSANFLGALSPALSMCYNLEELNIASNPLRALPSFLSNLTSLRVLIADATGIHTLPDSLTSLDKLHTLSIRRNKMYSLPGWLCLLSSLETLLVDGNPFQGPWKALVEPLLTKVIPNSPLYPPSTPGLPSAAGSITSADTDTDTEDLEQSPNVGSNSVPTEDEDHTMTPARAQLERATTSPYSLDSAPRGSGGGLSRNRTTPNRAYYEKARSPANSQKPNDPQSAASDKAYPGEREVRRMKSATELRETKSQGPSPSRSTYTHYATSLSSSNLLMTTPPQPIPQSPPMETKVPPKRFASLGVTGSPTRITANRSRPPLSNTSWDTVLEEEHSAGPSSSTSSTFTVSSNPPTPPQRKSLAKSRPPSSPGDDFERRLRKEEKDRSSRWGFLKKMSMGKIKPDVPSKQERPQLPSSSSSTQSLGRSQTSRATENGPPSINVLIPTTSMLDSPPRNFTTSQIFEKASSDISSNFPSDPLKRMLSTDALKGLPPIHSNANPPPTTSLVPPPTGPTPRASKRRSFLPIDLSLQGLNVSPATNSAFSEEDPSDSRPTPSPRPSTVEVAESLQRREEERAREFYTRALRSVMAYLRDMHDLSQSQLNVLSMYGSSTPDLSSSRSRRPTMVETNRGVSEHSILSTDSGSQSRSADSRGGSRNGTDQSTNSMITVDSTGSAEEKEKQAKPDKVKRLRIVREIVETERTYVKGLQELVDIYIKPACAPVNALTGGSKETVVPAIERKIVFSGLEALFSFHKESFLPALEKAAASVMQQSELAAETDKDGAMSMNVARTVGNCFISHAAFMRMYSTYINNMDNSVHRIKYWVSERASPVPPPSSLSPSSSTAQLVGLSLASMTGPAVITEPVTTNTAQLTSSQRKRIKSYLKRCKMNPRHSQLNLEGYLLLPVQRIPRYRLLLEELVKCSSHSSQYMGDPIERALTEISSLATGMNEGKREAEGRRKLVQWQARIRGKFPSPLVQPHRRLIMDGALSLTRVVRKATIAFEVIDSHGDASTVQVECLAPEMTPRALIGILCNDLLVLCRDPSQGQDPNSPVDLWAVLRMQTLPQPASIVHGNALRLVDNKAILYFDAPTPSEALNWYRAINLHIPASKT